MQLVKIYATGSCNPEKKQGHGHAILSCNGTEKHVAVALDNTTVNRCIIHAIIASVRAIKQPCSLRIITATSITTKKFQKSKNANLLRTLFSEIEKRNCTHELEVVYGEELRSKISSFFTSHPSKIMAMPPPVADASSLDERTLNLAF